MPPSRLRQLLKFLRVFGITGGLRLWGSLLAQGGKTSGLLRLPVPGLAAPLYVRSRDLPIFWQIWVMRENDFSALPQAERVKASYQAALAAGKTPLILDCGGHIGLSAVWFASRFPQAKVYTVEPSSANFEILQKNTGPYRNVERFNGGVWGQSCHLEISNPDSGSASFRLREVFDVTGSERPDLLRAYTLDELAEKEPQNELLLVKVDIEGAEAELFRRPAAWMQQMTGMIIELHDWLLPGKGTSTNLFRRLGEQPFDVVLQGENLLVFRSPEQAEKALRGEQTTGEPALVS
jgi:FkbM family methyltransferase